MRGKAFICTQVVAVWAGDVSCGAWKVTTRTVDVWWPAASSAGRPAAFSAAGPYLLLFECLDELVELFGGGGAAVWSCYGSGTLSRCLAQVCAAAVSAAL